MQNASDGEGAAFTAGTMSLSALMTMAVSIASVAASSTIRDAIATSVSFSSYESQDLPHDLHPSRLLWKRPSCRWTSAHVRSASTPVTP